METRANFVTVGLFTLIVLAASFAFIYWVARFDETTNLVPLNVRIEGAVTGLGEGSDVLFNGIRIGKVDRVVFDAQDPRIVYAVTRVKADAPLRRDSDATIGSQGLTGVSFISIKGGSPEAPLLLDGEGDEVPVIEVGAAAVTDVMETVREVAGRASKVMASLENFIRENREPFAATVKNAEKFSDALARNADNVDKIVADIGELSARLNQASARIEGVMAKLEDVLGTEEGGGVMDEARQTLAEYRTLAQNLNRRVEEIGGGLSEFSNRGLDDVRVLVQEARRSISRIDRAVADFERNPQRFLTGGNQVKSFEGRPRR